MFLILKAWCDRMENDPHAAFGYAPYAVTDSEEQAREFCAKGGTVNTEDFGWAAPPNAPIFKYQSVMWLAR